ncbi:hypothetical protein [Nocardiopsis composta]|uniref:Uncharacterized protein n=1 Tax=Nocardiopsis composta TaxID=157465 RepID=A0A7W8QHG6_9ACTN|nr:hypothetical protein [Nocardiopsis composta]MBB5430109.1 hypothetical protein [Nocardiopsis composta]
MTDDETALLDEERLLQAEAEEVAADLRLDERLSALGDPVRVGAAALGVLVRRDLDVTVACPRLDAAAHRAVADLGARLSRHPRVREVLIRDDTGAWNTDPAYPDGLYLGVRYRSPQGRDWTLDLWFVDEPERQPDLAHLRELGPALTPRLRAAVLAIKRALLDRPGPGTPAGSHRVYRAVVEDGVRTPEEFDAWSARRR